MRIQSRRREFVNCPHCGAVNSSTESRCESCSKALTIYIGPSEGLPRRFGVGSLMLLVASVALGLAALRGAPMLGVLVLFLIPPALVRTMAVVSQRTTDERPMLLDETMGVFFASIGVMMAVLLSSFLAFAIVCMPVGSMTMGAGTYGMILAVSLSGTVALGAAIWVLRKLWPYKG
jgi:hypothetical protein